ncbi:hypothetical protein HRbin16_01645 [bacterium HR16]|nr:hypothetical protein HRbin16_01645 [bacterium HR16]
MVQFPPIKLGLIAANRGFFSDELAAKMRNETIAAMREVGIEVVVPDESMTELGCVETLKEAYVAGKLFREKAVDGIVVAAVNFGDEQGVAAAIKTADLNVPIYIFGCQEEEVLTPSTPRRDSFCGLLSIGEALRQLGVDYTVGRVPILFPREEAFKKDIQRFAAVCRVVNGIRKARYGQIGARPDAFWTCRYDEKMLQRLGPTVVTLDLSEAIAGVQRIPADSAEVRQKMEQIAQYADAKGVPAEVLNKIARFELFVERFVEEKELDALAIQCWTSIQMNLGICTCTTMSRLGDRGIPCACESDIMGTLSMHAALLASGAPATLADWNNLHNEDPELANLWHCGVYPTTFAKTTPRIGVQEIIATTTGRENATGVIEFEVKEGPVTLCRITQSPDGEWKAALAQGTVEENRAKTFGAYGWCRIPGLQRFYRDVLCRHFPHHVAMTLGSVGDVLWEALGNYLGMDVYAPDAPSGYWTPEPPFWGE